jgi:hypothetical protein
MVYKVTCAAGNLLAQLYNFMRPNKMTTIDSVAGSV